MRLALVGADDETLELVRWAVFSGGHELVAAYDVGSRGGDVAAIAPGVQVGDDWEALVVGSQVLGSRIDAVIVARGQAGLAAEKGIADDERRADQLRKLAQAAVPMLVVCPACESIVGFEIEMIRRDASGIIVPYVPGAGHPAVRQLGDLASWQGASPIGSIEQITFERALTDRSRASVLAAFAKDAAIIRHLIGTIRSVSATGPVSAPGRDPLGPKPKEPPPLSNLSVYVGGDGGAAVRWSVLPSHGSEAATITVIGQSGTTVLRVPQDNEWRIETDGAEPQIESFPASPGCAEVLSELSHAMSRVRYDEEAWLNACRDQEAAEAIDRSLARGRTIELFNEEHTEEDSFKGIMAMGGCLLLVGALGVVFIATIVEGLRLPLRDWAVWRFWPVYLLVPIAVFLLLQLLQLVVKKDAPDLRRLVSGENRTE